MVTIVNNGTNGSTTGRITLPILNIPTTGQRNQQQNTFITRWTGYWNNGSSCLSLSGISVADVGCGGCNSTTTNCNQPTAIILSHPSIDIRAVWDEYMTWAEQYVPANTMQNCDITSNTSMQVLDLSAVPAGEFKPVTQIYGYDANGTALTITYPRMAGAIYSGKVVRVNVTAVRSCSGALNSFSVSFPSIYTLAYNAGRQQQSRQQQ